MSQRRTRARRVGSVLGAAGLALLTGCSSSSGGSPSSGTVAVNSQVGTSTGAASSSGSAPGASASASASAAGGAGTAAAGGLQAAIEQIGLQNGDLNNHFTVQVIPSGDTVAGQVSLDNCAFTFTTEKYRLARHQIAMLDASGQDAGVSNEVIAYDTPAHAAQALTEWRASVAHCTAGVDVTPAEAGAPVVRYDAEKSDPEANLPVQANDLTTTLLTVKATGKPLYGVSVMQQRGQILDIIWSRSTAKPPAAQINALIDLAGVTGQRLARR